MDKVQLDKVVQVGGHAIVVRFTDGTVVDYKVEELLALRRERAKK